MSYFLHFFLTIPGILVAVLVFVTATLGRFFLKQWSTSATRNLTLKKPGFLCHAYSELAGHEYSPGIVQYMPYLKLRLTDPFCGLFWVISELGSPDYIVKSTTMNCDLTRCSDLKDAWAKLTSKFGCSDQISIDISTVSIAFT